MTVPSLHGNVVVISIWATWRGCCVKKAPVLANLKTVVTQRHLPLQAVSIDDTKSRQSFVRASRALRAKLPNLPNLLLAWGREGSRGQPCGIPGIPVLVLPHRDATDARVPIGYGEGMFDTLAGQINGLLNEPATPASSVAAN